MNRNEKLSKKEEEYKDLMSKSKARQKTTVKMVGDLTSEKEKLTQELTAVKDEIDEIQQREVAAKHQKADASKKKGTEKKQQQELQDLKRAKLHFEVLSLNASLKAKYYKWAAIVIVIEGCDNFAIGDCISYSDLQVLLQ